MHHFRDYMSFFLLSIHILCSTISYHAAGRFICIVSSLYLNIPKLLGPQHHKPLCAWSVYAVYSRIATHCPATLRSRHSGWRHIVRGTLPPGTFCLLNTSFGGFWLIEIKFIQYFKYINNVNTFTARDISHGSSHMPDELSRSWQMRHTINVPVTSYLAW